VVGLEIQRYFRARYVLVNVRMIMLPRSGAGVAVHISSGGCPPGNLSLSPARTTEVPPS